MADFAASAAVGFIRLYQATLGRIVGGNCRFHPNCSEYAVQAIRARGAARGTAMAMWRIVRCGPWSRGGVDYPASRKGEKILNV